MSSLRPGAETPALLIVLLCPMAFCPAILTSSLRQDGTTFRPNLKLALGRVSQMLCRYTDVLSRKMRAAAWPRTLEGGPHGSANPEAMYKKYLVAVLAISILSPFRIQLR